MSYFALGWMHSAVSLLYCHFFEMILWVYSLSCHIITRFIVTNLKALTPHFLYYNFKRSWNFGVYLNMTSTFNPFRPLSGTGFNFFLAIRWQQSIMCVIEACCLMAVHVHYTLIPSRRFLDLGPSTLASCVSYNAWL